ncbi:uncharacterized protein LOC117182100 isoform X1 [Belonocnema kinseyi]|uniref:uncharacterized protein LOC117182100 isoform X1 n=1 Tax=Belonocnema kinseyi TaxID=2817044 RepID=UPI00143D55C2|nr:uncharacterized protein LOC117182100 isoform X1 [Belonocnema kinseyi]
MEIHRASVLLSGKEEILSLCNKNKEILECISGRNNLELADFKLLNNMNLRKKGCNEQIRPENFEKDDGYNMNKLLNPQDIYANLQREKSINVYCRTRKHTENQQLSDKDLNQNIADIFENNMKAVLANMKKYLLEEPLSSELQKSFKHIFCHTEDALSCRKSGYKTVLRNMSFEILGKSPLQPIARQNGIQLLQEFQDFPLFCEEIINYLTKVLMRLSVLIYENTSDGLKVVDETVFLLHSLKKLLEIFSEISKDLNNELVGNNSKYIEYKKSYNNSMWKSFQHKKVQKWKARVEKFRKSNYAQVSFIAGKCAELLNIHFE